MKYPPCSSSISSLFHPRSYHHHNQNDNLQAAEMEPVWWTSRLCSLSSFLRNHLTSWNIKIQKKAQKIAPCFCSLTSSLQNGLPQASAHPHLYSVLDPNIIPSWANYHQNCVSTESSNLKMSIKLQCKSYIMYCMHRRSEIVCCGTKSLAFSICGRVNREWHWIGSDMGALAWALEALGEDNVSASM